jgi:hypothetical protein
MNKQLALILLDKLKDASYLDRTSGIVQVITRVTEGDGGIRVEKKLPFTSFATYEDYGNAEKLMVPDSRFKSCLYFEDNGVIQQNASAVRGVRGATYESRIRIVCWLNTLIISGAPDMLLSAKVMADIVKRLTQTPHFNSEPFININTSIATIPAQDDRIFSQYDYDATRTQYLMSPFDFFAIDLLVNYQIPDACLNSFVVVNKTDC